MRYSLSVFVVVALRPRSVSVAESRFSLLPTCSKSVYKAPKGKGKNQQQQQQQSKQQAAAAVPAPAPAPAVEPEQESSNTTPAPASSNKRAREDEPAAATTSNKAGAEKNGDVAAAAAVTNGGGAGGGEPDKKKKKKDKKQKNKDKKEEGLAVATEGSKPASLSAFLTSVVEPLLQKKTPETSGDVSLAEVRRTVLDAAREKGYEVAQVEERLWQGLKVGGKKGKVRVEF